MEKIKELNRYQKGILILLVAMAVIFGILYAKATSKTGFLYMDKILEVSSAQVNFPQESGPENKIEPGSLSLRISSLNRESTL